MKAIRERVWMDGWLYPSNVEVIVIGRISVKVNILNVIDGDIFQVNFLVDASISCAIILVPPSESKESYRSIILTVCEEYSEVDHLKARFKFAESLAGIPQQIALKLQDIVLLHSLYVLKVFAS